MISSKEIRNVTFSNSVGGYRKEEVDILLDKIEVDYEQYEKLVAVLTEQNEQLKLEIEECKKSQNSIQNVLLSAQRLADQIVEEANQKSKAIVEDAQNSIVDITEKSKKIAEEFDARATEKKAKLQQELDKINEEAQTKRALIEHAAAECVQNQQETFDNIKSEIAAFKAEITAKYKEHLEILASLPISAEIDPKRAVTRLKDDFEKIKSAAKEEPVSPKEAEEPVVETNNDNDGFLSFNVDTEKFFDETEK